MCPHAVRRLHPRRLCPVPGQLRPHSCLGPGIGPRRLHPRDPWAGILGSRRIPAVPHLNWRRPCPAPDRSRPMDSGRVLAIAHSSSSRRLSCRSRALLLDRAGALGRDRPRTSPDQALASLGVSTAAGLSRHRGLACLDPLCAAIDTGSPCCSSARPISPSVSRRCDRAGAGLIGARYMPSLYQTLWMLMIGYAVRFMPQALGASKRLAAAGQPPPRRGLADIRRGPRRDHPPSHAPTRTARNSRRISASSP